jgi:integrase
MRALRLTDIAVRNLKPDKKQYEVGDLNAKGLRIVVHPSGAKSGVVRYRFVGKPRKLTLPNGISLAAWRKLTADALLEVAQGRDPAEAKQEHKKQARKAAEQARAATELRTRDSVAARATEYIEKYAKRETRPSSWKQTESIFNRIVLPAWRGRSVHDIRRRDAIDLIEAVAEGNKDTPPRPVMANRTRAVGHTFFAWLCSRDAVATNPFAGVAVPSREVARERILSDDEIKLLWAACSEINPRHGAAIRILLLSGQRRNEVLQLPRAEIEEGTRIWTLPAVRAKNGKSHAITLSTQAWQIITSVPTGDPLYVFGTRTIDARYVKSELDKRLSFAAGWRIHDLRRTCASGLQKVGTPIHIIEQVLNHRSGTFRGVAGVYLRHVYDAEKAAALQRWGDYVERLVSGKADDNVLPMVKAVSLG